MKIFDLIPGWTWALTVVALVMSLLISDNKTQAARAALASTTALVATATAKAEATARATEKTLQTQAERITHEHDQKTKDIATHAAAALHAANSLRGTIDQLNARSATAAPEPASLARQATTARDLLATCADTYRRVAADTDELSTQVSGLQDFIATATTNPATGQ